MEDRFAIGWRWEAKRIGDWEFRLWKETPVKCSRGAQIRFADFCEIFIGAGRLKGESLCYLALHIFLYVINTLSCKEKHASMQPGSLITSFAAVWNAAKYSLIVNGNGKELMNG